MMTKMTTMIWRKWEIRSQLRSARGIDGNSPVSRTLTPSDTPSIFCCGLFPFRPHLISSVLLFVLVFVFRLRLCVWCARRWRDELEPSENASTGLLLDNRDKHINVVTYKKEDLESNIVISTQVNDPRAPLKTPPSVSSSRRQSCRAYSHLNISLLTWVGTSHLLPCHYLNTTVSHILYVVSMVLWLLLTSPKRYISRYK